MNDHHHAALDWIESHHPLFVEEIIRICEIPAPTFDEAARSAYLQGRFAGLGLPVETDEVGNVVGRLGGTRPGPRTLLVAHLDTVFPAGTDLTVRQEAGRLQAPGVGDNSTSVASVVLLAELLTQLRIDFPGELLLAGSVGEEGLGDLRGMRVLMDQLDGRVDQVVAIDGYLGELVTRAVGSRRYRFRVATPGGHSWADFGRPSAVHLLARLVARLADLTVPQEPRTTFNVGTFHGGTSVNTIAGQAESLLDMRSVDPAALAALERQALAIADAWEGEVAYMAGCSVVREMVGDRPAGASDNQAMVTILQAVAEQQELRLATTASSTDASIPLHRGVPAVCMGVYRGGGAHTLEEWVDVASLIPGLTLLYRGMMGLQAGR